MLFFFLNLIFSLKNRQEQWKNEEETRKANMPDPTIPAGHSLMPEAERRKTMEMLQKCKIYLISWIYDFQPVAKGGSMPLKGC